MAHLGELLRSSKVNQSIWMSQSGLIRFKVLFEEESFEGFWFSLEVSQFLSNFSFSFCQSSWIDNFQTEACVSSLIFFDFNDIE